MCHVGVVLLVILFPAEPYACSRVTVMLGSVWEEKAYCVPGRPTGWRHITCSRAMMECGWKDPLKSVQQWILTLGF